MIIIPEKGELVKKAVLVTGGAGYIGSHVAYALHIQGYHVIILDSFLHKQSIPLNWGTTINDDYGNIDILDQLFSTYVIDAVIHLAGYIEVGESVKDPARFYHNNVVKSLTLFDAMKKHNVKKCIFSSSCAVYGNPTTLPINEQHILAPQNPYGKTKLAIEFALQDYAQSYGFSYIILRYFNAAGASPEAHIGEQHVPETHVIPLLLRAARTNSTFTLYGNNYETKDGTCIRDYIHVRDIANAHLKAYAHLQKQARSNIFNLGTGVGKSIQELIATAEKVCNKKIALSIKPRRAGDVGILIADPQKAHQILGWRATHSDLVEMFSSVYLWENDQQKRSTTHKNLKSETQTFKHSNP